MILREDGSVWSTPIHSLGDFAPSRHISGYFVQLLEGGATAMAAGNSYGMIIKQDGNIWAMGHNYRGQLGDGTRKAKEAFSFAAVIAGAKDVSAGGGHTLVLTETGDVWATGWNKFGQLGDGATTMYAKTYGKIKFFVALSNDAKAVAAGDFHSVVLKKDGSVWATGRNNNGQLGDGTKTDSSVYIQVLSSGATNVAAGGHHSIVLKYDGSVLATGWNEFGQLGDGSQTDRTNYVQVIVSGVESVSAGNRHSMVLKKDGSVWATGYNRYGQLGDGSTSNRDVFVQVISDGVKVVAAGGFHAMVVKKDGSIWATGFNKYSQLGDGWTTSQKTFIRVVPFDNGAEHDHMNMDYFHEPTFAEASSIMFSAFGSLTLARFSTLLILRNCCHLITTV